MSIVTDDYAGHRFDEPHDCFAANCRGLRHELEVLRKRLEARATVPLDVERLAASLEARFPLSPGPYERFADGVREGMYRSLAEQIATEYNRLIVGSRT